MVSSSNPQPTAEPVPNSCSRPGRDTSPIAFRGSRWREKAIPRALKPTSSRNSIISRSTSGTQSPELSPFAARWAIAPATKAYISATTKMQKERRRVGLGGCGDRVGGVVTK